MKQTLQLRTSQHLALTPQLQQSIRLLQLSTLELHQELEQILAENPLLERLDDPLERSVRLLADGAIAANTVMPESATAASSEPAAADASDTTTDAAEATTADGEWSFDDVARTSKAPEDDDARPQLEAQRISLREHLLQQTGEMAQQQRDRALLELVIEALNENGYLEEPLDDIHARLPPQLGIDIEELAIALKMLQSFDPAGVGARDAAECLALQIRRLPQVPLVTRRLALQIVEQHLAPFAQRDFNKLKKALDCDDEDLREAQAVIRQCNPHPGAVFASDTSDYVVPDVVVKRTRAGWQALLNQEVIPRLRVHSLYASILKQHKGDGSLTTQLQEAKWLIKNMRQRFDTILRVSQAIVDR